MWPKSGSLRDRLALLAAGATVTALCVALVFSRGTEVLMPGPLASAHGTIKTCTACHSKSGSDKISWMQGLVSGNPHTDSKACLSCHKMPETAFNPHGASAQILKESTDRLDRVAAALSAPLSARIQSVAFPTADMMSSGLPCATCHKEHKGTSFNLAKISDEQCRSCHVVKFDSFDGSHPKFDSYPFKKRTPIIFDHAGHFGKHFPEVGKKNPTKNIPTACSTCHSTSDDRRIMSVAPFEKTCSTCHLDQITGKERVSGPKGVAFLSLPGIDVQTLRSKNAAIGEWPDASEAVLTPFMKAMISRTDAGRTVIKTVDGINLQDLNGATEPQIKAVTDLVWEIKRLFYGMIEGKTPEVLGNLNIGEGVKLSTNLATDLTASLPRDVVLSAQQQWLPNLAEEITNGPLPNGKKPTSASTAAAEPASNPSPPAEEASDSDEPKTKSTDKAEADGGETTTKKAKLDPPTCLVRVLGNCLVEKPGADPGTSSDESENSSAKTTARKQKSSAAGFAPAMQAGLAQLAEAETKPSASEQSRGKPANQSDDLLFPTEQELKEMKGRYDDSGTGASPEPAASSAASASTPAISIGSDVDPESWAELGGWYRQDYAIYYRPTGHKDKFIYSWLFLTGPQARRGSTAPMAAVFNALTSKDAQGTCTKCHSVDDIEGRGRVVNFSPPSGKSKQGRFTNFIHEPHLGVLDNRGCLTCHEAQKDTPYLKSYEQGDPHKFASNFGQVKKELCQGCHTTNAARQDCLTCHKYHINGVMTPIINTKLPFQ